ncbi:MAG: hypoxanthine phosphoribosyltransferase [Candidatus Krumholzibacteria bacterium]|nr:hypoxanthine phosphoribosyltransferase [Candidatus Krumholzibacteria bacterium]
MTYDDQDILRRLPNLDRVLIGSQEIGLRIRQLGVEISRDYAGTVPILVCVLKGAFVFLADLSRCISIPHAVDFMAVSSYEGGTQSTGVVKIEKDLVASISGRDVILVEDIVDSGLTLNHLVELLQTRAPRSLRICTLLDKVAARVQPIAVDYRGFEIPKEFVVGFGLDYEEQYRNLPFIGVLKP